MAKRKLPALHIDFSRTPVENIESVYPLSDASMSNALGDDWSADDVRRINSQVGIYTDVPWRCKGCSSATNVVSEDARCPYSDHCPIDPDVVNDRFVGRACPVEVVEAFKFFSGYVLDLDIKPDDFTDIQTVADLIRLHIQLRRCDLYQKDKPIYDEKHGAVWQKTGEAKKDKVANLGWTMAKEIRSDLSKKYEQLVATRKEKVKAEAALGKAQQDSVTVFSRLREIGTSLGMLDGEEPPQLTDGSGEDDIDDAEILIDDPIEE